MALNAFGERESDVGAVGGRSLTTRTAALLAVAIFFCLATASAASAAASYVFEPTLSLTGDCTTSPRDEVPDPGPCPGTKGPNGDHPTSSFRDPITTIDAYGDIYTISGTEDSKSIDVFGPDGTFLTEFKAEFHPQSIAVDSKGNVYVFESPIKIEGGQQVVRFSPTVYEPKAEKINYEKPPVLVVSSSEMSLGFETAVAVDASDRLYVVRHNAVSIFKSAENGNALVAKQAIGGLTRSQSIAVDSIHKKIYLSDTVPGTSVVRVFELEPPYAEIKDDEIDGSTIPTPPHEFVSGEGLLQLAVDDETGHVFVGDTFANKVYEFAEDGTYLAAIEHSFEGTRVAIDKGPFSPHPQKDDWLFVASGEPTPGHVYAFEPKEECEPEVETASVSEVTETEATLRATINPCSLETTYRLEYVSQQQFEEEEGKSFENESATIAGEGTLSKGGEGVAVSAPAIGLEPATEYRFRAFAENALGEDSEERTFKTFPAEGEPPTCENKAFRVGASAFLPDCRAFELVTPPNTNGRRPSGGFSGYAFPVQRSSADGNTASFLFDGGSLPGSESAGSFNGDPYLATRTAEGWTTHSAGPSGKEAVGPQQVGLSSDQAYSAWISLDGASHVRYPDGHSELVGRGGLGEDPQAKVGLITEAAGHIIFGGAVPLEPNAPPPGTAAVYDRSAEGPTHVVSLLLGDETPKAGENAKYLGASEDGEGIVFEISGTIYLRLHNAETFKVAGPSSTFAGLADEGKRVFYTEGGDLFAYDAEADETIPFSSSGDVTPVNVASGGSRAYFVSPSVLTGEPNPNGEEAQGGKENLYLSKEGTIGFVGTVTEGDVKQGLGQWLEVIKNSVPAVDPSRATPSGATLLFQSRADLTGFESDGFAQIYRYDADQNRLDCLSCSPTNTPPTSDASLQSTQAEQFSLEPAGSQLKIANQSPDGKRAFFQTAQPLVVRDTDEQLDVYEWEEEGVGSCKTQGGCIYLISGAHSASPDYLFAMSGNGDNVFFRTSDLLLPRDAEGTLSIYDARVGGGFAEPEPAIPCMEGETCRSSPTPPPHQSQPTTSVVGPDGNLPPSARKCPKGKRAVKRAGKTTCVKKRHKHRTGTGRKGVTK